MHKTILSMVVFSWIGGFVPGAGAQNLSPADQMARDIFKQLIEINTTDSVGNVTTAAEAMAERLRNAGFAEDDLHVAGPSDRKKNLVVRFRGAGKRTTRFFLRSEEHTSELQSPVHLVCRLLLEKKKK